MAGLVPAIFAGESSASEVLIARSKRAGRGSIQPARSNRLGLCALRWNALPFDLRENQGRVR
jgi:hypothetical protein